MDDYLPVGGAAEVLAAGKLEVLGVMPRASNFTFAARITHGATAGLVIYKPQRGETPLWDFSDGTLYAREVAAFVVCESLGWSFVPPTIARMGEHGLGSVQVCIRPDPTEHYLSLAGGTHDDDFRRICAFDIVVNNADRKSGHVMREQATGRIFAIDHGVCFHVEPKLRTVIWDFAGDPLPDEVLADLGRLIEDLRSGGSCAKRLTPLLTGDEIRATAARARALLDAGTFPEPPEDRRPYPWPPV
jgi:hypothetical protein